MLKLDNTLLDELGLGSLPEDQKRAMLQHIYETLELRVGTDLANQMSDAQLEEFEKFIDDGGDANQAQALQWLEANLPNYKQVVNEVFDALKVEVKGMAPQLLQAAGLPPATAQPVAASSYGQPAPTSYAQPQSAAVNYAQSPTMQPAANQFAAPVPQPAAAAVDFTTPAPTFAAPAALTDFSTPSTAVPTGFTTPAPVDPFASNQPVQPPQPVPQTYYDNTTQQPAAPAQDPSGYQFPPQQPPAGPGSFPSQQ